MSLDTLGRRLRSRERRRPVPRDWREAHHYLSTSSRAHGHGIWRVSRTKGRCSCGARWPEGQHVDNLVYADVRELWLDHVEREFYKQADEATT